MTITKQPWGLVGMTLALLLSGCAALHPHHDVATAEARTEAIHEPAIMATANEAPAGMETPVLDPVEVVLRVQELYFQYEGIGTQRDAYGQLHLLVGDCGFKFDFGSGRLNPTIAMPLRHVAAVLIGYPESRLTISGHTDDIGSEQMNLRLSQARADAVRDALLHYGVPRRTIAAAIGYGEAHPIADNSTVEGRAMNRRVDLRIAIDAAEAAANQKQHAATSATD